MGSVRESLSTLAVSLCGLDQQLQQLAKNSLDYLAMYPALSAVLLLLLLLLRSYFSTIIASPLAGGIRLEPFRIATSHDPVRGSWPPDR